MPETSTNPEGRQEQSKEEKKEQLKNGLWFVLGDLTEKSPSFSQVLGQRTEFGSVSYNKVGDEHKINGSAEQIAKLKEKFGDDSFRTDENGTFIKEAIKYVEIQNWVNKSNVSELVDSLEVNNDELDELKNLSDEFLTKKQEEVNKKGNLRSELEEVDRNYGLDDVKEALNEDTIDKDKAIKKHFKLKHSAFKRAWWKLGNAFGINKGGWEERADYNEQEGIELEKKVRVKKLMEKKAGTAKSVFWNTFGREDFFKERAKIWKVEEAKKIEKELNELTRALGALLALSTRMEGREEEAQRSEEEQPEVVESTESVPEENTQTERRQEDPGALWEAFLEREGMIEGPDHDDLYEAFFNREGYDLGEDGVKPKKTKKKAKPTTPDPKKEPKKDDGKGGAEPDGNKKTDVKGGDSKGDVDGNKKEPIKQKEETWEEKAERYVDKEFWKKGTFKRLKGTGHYICELDGAEYVVHNKNLYDLIDDRGKDFVGDGAEHFFRVVVNKKDGKTSDGREYKKGPRKVDCMDGEERILVNIMVPKEDKKDDVSGGGEPDGNKNSDTRGGDSKGEVDGNKKEPIKQREETWEEKAERYIEKGFWKKGKFSRYTDDEGKAQYICEIEGETYAVDAANLDYLRTDKGQKFETGEEHYFEVRFNTKRIEELSKGKYKAGTPIKVEYDKDKFGIKVYIKVEDKKDGEGGGTVEPKVEPKKAGTTEPKKEPKGKVEINPEKLNAIVDIIGKSVLNEENRKSTLDDIRGGNYDKVISFLELTKKASGQRDIGNLNEIIEKVKALKSVDSSGDSAIEAIKKAADLAKKTGDVKIKKKGEDEKKDERKELLDGIKEKIRKTDLPGGGKDGLIRGLEAENVNYDNLENTISSRVSDENLKKEILEQLNKLKNLKPIKKEVPIEELNLDEANEIETLDIGKRDIVKKIEKLARNYGIDSQKGVVGKAILALNSDYIDTTTVRLLRKSVEEVGNEDYGQGVGLIEKQLSELRLRHPKEREDSAEDTFPSIQKALNRLIDNFVTEDDDSRKETLLSQINDLTFDQRSVDNVARARDLFLVIRGDVDIDQKDGALSSIERRLNKLVEIEELRRDKEEKKSKKEAKTSSEGSGKEALSGDDEKKSSEDETSDESEKKVEIKAVQRKFIKTGLMRAGMEDFENDVIRAIEERSIEELKTIIKDMEEARGRVESRYKGVITNSINIIKNLNPELKETKE